MCSAVSTLITGSAEIWKNSRFVEIIKLEDKFTFKFSWNEEEESKNLRTEYFFIQKHLKLLSQVFPKNIEYRIN